MDALNSADQAINSANFVKAAKMIEYSNIQPALVQNIVKHELQRKRMAYAYPATIGNAQIHREAYKFGYNPSQTGQYPRVCPCCLEKVRHEDIGLCYHTSKVDIEQQIGYSQYKLKPGIALFFSFIKMITAYFLLIFLISDGFNLLTNITSGQYCNDDGQTDCYPILWNIISMQNKKNNTKFIMIQDILSLVVVVLSILFFFIYRKSQYSMAKVINNKNQAEQDYTLLIQNIPLIDFPSKAQAKKMRTNQTENIQLYHRQHLWKYFQGKIKTWLDRKNKWSNGNNELDFKNLLNQNDGQLRSNQIVKSISLCYNLQRLETLQKQRDQLVKNHHKYQKLRKQLQEQADDSSLGIAQVESDNRFSSIAKQVQFLNDCQVILNKQYASDNSVLFNITNFVGKALISFQYQHYREYILEEADRDLNFLVFNGSRLKVSRVSNPRDILWKNLRHPVEKQKKKLMTTLYILLIIALICFVLLCAAQFGRIKAQQLLKNDQNSLFGKIGIYGFVGVSILIILLTNQTILVMARKRTKQQCLYSRTQESFSIILKVVIFQFICTAVFPYLVSRVFNTQIAGKTGLIFQITVLVIFYGVFMNILSLIYPKAVARFLILFCKYKNKKPQDQVDTFQKQLNKQFQYVEFDIISQYTNYILLTFVTCFYAYLIPLLSLVLVVIFFLQYWIDKINLFKRSSLPRSFSFYLSRTVLKIFEACIWIFAIGTVIFGIQIHGNFLNILNLVTFGVASIYFWFLLGASIKLQRKLFGNYQSSQRALYDDCASAGKFEETYWTQNPATYLVRESDITGRQTVSNPAINKIFMSYRLSN